MSLNNKVALVTGSNSGIGKAIALKLCSMGASVVITGRDEQRISEMVDKCRQQIKTINSGFKQTVIGCKADICNDTDIYCLVDILVKQYGKCDILVNNAGIGIYAEFTNNNYIEVFDKQMQFLRGVQLVTQLISPYLIAQTGSIINISAPNERPIPLLMAYFINKSCVNMITKCLANEMTIKGVRVNTISPGLTVTPMVESDPKFSHLLSANVADNVALGRLASVDDVANAVASIVIDNNVSIMSTNLHIDGGDKEITVLTD